MAAEETAGGGGFSRTLGPVGQSGGKGGSSGSYGVIGKFTGMIVAAEGDAFSYMADPGQAQALAEGVIEVNPQLYPLNARTIKTLRVTTTNGNGATAYVVTLYKNGVSTGMRVTVPPGSAARSTFLDAAHPVALAAGDCIDLRVDKAVSPDDAASLLSAVLEGDGGAAPPPPPPPPPGPSLIDLRLWNRSDLGVTPSGSGASVWDDESGNGNNVVQPTDAERLAITALAQGGLPALTGSAQPSQGMNNDTVNLAAAGEGRSVYVVCKPASADGGFLFTFRRANPTFSCILGWLGVKYVFFDGVNAATIPLIPAGQALIAEWHSTGAGVGTLTVYLNGGKQVLSGSTTVAPDSGTNGFSVANSEYNTAAVLNGDEQEILVYGPSHQSNPVERAKTIRWLSRYLIPAPYYFADSLSQDQFTDINLLFGRPNSSGGLRINVPAGTTSVTAQLLTTMPVNPSLDRGWGVFVDNVYNTTWTPASLNTLETFVLALDGAAHVVELRAGFLDVINATAIYSVTGTGITFLPLPTATRRLADYGTSIECGAYAGTIAIESYFNIFRTAYPGRCSLEAWGNRSLSQDTGVGSAAQHYGFGNVTVLAQRLVDLCFGATTREIYIAIGVNDWINAYMTKAQFQATANALATGIHAIDPGAKIFWQTMLITGHEATPNANGDLPSDFRTAATAAMAGLPYVTVVNGPGLMSAIYLSADGIHPTTPGQAQLAGSIEGVVI